LSFSARARAVVSLCMRPRRRGYRFCCRSSRGPRKATPNPTSLHLVPLRSIAGIAGRLRCFYERAHRGATTTFHVGTWADVAKKYLSVYQTVYFRGCARSVGVAMPSDPGSDLAVLSQNLNPARGAAEPLECGDHRVNALRGGKVKVIRKRKMFPL
jgi:hypothetical protein